MLVMNSRSGAFRNMFLAALMGGLLVAALGFGAVQAGWVGKTETTTKTIATANPVANDDEDQGLVNQIYERDIDRLMRRTQGRPLPAGRLDVGEARWFASALALAGLVELGLGTTWLAAAVAAATIGSYALVYTPLKTRTSLSTVVGAVPGALPPLIGLSLIHI